MARALLSLGSNIEPRRSYLVLALKALNKGDSRVLKVSDLYESAAVDVTDQADFLNMAVEIETQCEPEKLLVFLQGIEASAGKKISRRRGPRTLDLDLLLLGDEQRNSASLILPHARMHRRAFVLEPLAQIAGEQMHPRLGRTVKQLLAGLPVGQKITCLGPLALDKE